MSLRPELAVRRGATLLEMMTAAAIGIVIVAAATALFNNMRSAAEISDRKLLTASDLQLGTNIMQRTIENAGYHFPAPAQAIAIHKNVPAGPLSNGYGQSALMVVQRVPAGSPPYTTAQVGIVEDSDVLEVLSGTNRGNSVQVAGVIVAGGERTVTFNASNMSDVLQYTPGDTGPVLLFRNAKMSCLGAMTEAPAVNRRRVTMINTLFEPDPAVPTACPALNMEVFRLGHRTRFMVYQFRGETRPHLAVQRETLAPGFPASPPGGDTGTAGLLDPVPVPIAESIEDLQVAAVMSRDNPGDATAPPVTDCTNPMCVCDDGLPDGAGADCQLSQVPGMSNATTIRGVRVELTSRGPLDRREEPMAGDPLRGQLPPSMDRPAPTTPDKVTRMQFRLAVEALNFNPALVSVGP